MKYPRTYHLPYSPGATKDDKKLQDRWFDNYKGKEIVITEKLDGENIHMNQKICIKILNFYFLRKMRLQIVCLENGLIKENLIYERIC